MCVYRGQPFWFLAVSEFNRAVAGIPAKVRVCQLHEPGAAATPSVVDRYVCLSGLLMLQNISQVAAPARVPPGMHGSVLLDCLCGKR